MIQCTPSAVGVFVGTLIAGTTAVEFDSVAARAHESWISGSRLIDPASGEWCCNHSTADVQARTIGQKRRSLSWVWLVLGRPDAWCRQQPALANRRTSMARNETTDPMSSAFFRRA